jgi:thiol:disulfide interchange protein DsbD
MDIGMHGGTVLFTQKVKLTGDVKEIKADVTYMACDDMQCLAPETLELVFKMPVIPSAVKEKKVEIKKEEKKATAVQKTESKPV